MDSNYELLETKDGSFTLYSKAYEQSYHSVTEGALSETLYKYVIPAFNYHHDKDEIVILDICFGLGFNTLASLWYNKNFAHKKLKIYSPELDEDLLNNLLSNPYPKELERFLPVLKSVIENRSYSDETLSIELFVGDARDYVRTFDNFFDIVYQDAFSPQVNPTLWTQEYFHDIFVSMKQKSILSTYSISLPVRLALFENQFKVYIHQEEGKRKFTIASKEELHEYKSVDMEHKVACNPLEKSLKDP